MQNTENRVRSTEYGVRSTEYGVRSIEYGVQSTEAPRSTQEHPGGSEPENLENAKFSRQFATNLTNGRNSWRYTQRF